MITVGVVNPLCPHLGKQVEAIHLRHAHVEDREVEVILRELLERLGATVGFQDVEALGFERDSIVEPDIRLVVHDQDLFCS